MSISARSMKALESMQRNELTEHYVYAGIAKRIKSDADRAVLMQIADEEMKHSKIWQEYTHKEFAPNKARIRFLSFLSRVFGYTFALKLMENGEDTASKTYAALVAEVPEAAQIAADEDAHEAKLLDILDEERLHYVGSMVLGLNDALVELTGTLAGMTFALQRTDLVALSGLITGISATLSMASSEYLSAKSEGRPDAMKSCVYTGIAYVITVALLVLPYLVLPSDRYILALGLMLAVVIVIILVFNYYISVAQGLNFRRRFVEMALISLGVAALSFAVGLLVKKFLGIDI